MSSSPAEAVPAHKEERREYGGDGKQRDEGHGHDGPRRVLKRGRNVADRARLLDHREQLPPRVVRDEDGGNVDLSGAPTRHWGRTRKVPF